MSVYSANASIFQALIRYYHYLACFWFVDSERSLHSLILIRCSLSPWKYTPEWSFFGLRSGKSGKTANCRLQLKAAERLQIPRELASAKSCSLEVIRYGKFQQRPRFLARWHSRSKLLRQGEFWENFNNFGCRHSYWGTCNGDQS